MFRRVSEWFRGLDRAIEEDMAEFEREALKGMPDGVESETTVTTERRNGGLLTITKTITKTTTRRVTRVIR